MLADRIKEMCEADLECRRHAPAWKLVTVVLNNAVSFDCCVVPPEALASHEQELDEIVEALFLLFVEQDRLESHTIKRMRLPRIAGVFDVAPMHLRSPMAFLSQYLAIAPSVAKAAEVRAMETLASSEQPRMRSELETCGDYHEMKEGCREKVTRQTERWMLPVWGDKGLRRDKGAGNNRWQRQRQSLNPW